jgi:hypothetical protein
LPHQANGAISRLPGVTSKFLGYRPGLTRTAKTDQPLDRDQASEVLDRPKPMPSANLPRAHGFAGSLADIADPFGSGMGIGLKPAIQFHRFRMMRVHDLDTCIAEPILARLKILRIGTVQNDDPRYPKEQDRTGAHGAG